MRNDKELVLSRIRAALGRTRHAPPTLPAQPEYLVRDEAPREEIIARFIERAADYRALVQRIAPGSERTAIQEALARRGVQKLAIPADLPDEWRPDGVELLIDGDVPLTYETLDRSDGVLTGCACAVAQTGTLVLNGGPAQGRRALTLLPDYQLCVVLADQIVGLMPEAVRRLAPADGEHPRPVTFISGPSATSDIELNRVEGVHGPRTLDILVVG
ncbi:MAG TPA: lactate utilization protein C [Longimicrobiales bacterium]|nr:lactate utilization protein C [Longimicrobiales bacterium]